MIFWGKFRLCNPWLKSENRHLRLGACSECLCLHMLSQLGGIGWLGHGTILGRLGWSDWSIGRLLGAVDWDGRDGWDGRGVASTIPIRPLDSDPTPIRA